MTTRFKTYTQIQANPSLAILKHLEGVDSLADKYARKAVAETLAQITNDFKNRLDELISQLENAIPDISKQIAEELKKYTLAHPELFKGQKGDSIKGEPGNSYILTENDKKEISSKIKIPIVEKIIEKTEVIKEQPIIKEVAISEDAEKIANKLNALKETIEIDVIKGLKEKFKNLNRNARKGGGMGNVCHQSFSVGVATTTFTTTYGVAAAGKAIWAYYQGQLIVNGTHYTGSGPTYTLTFVPQASTMIDVIYVRG